MIARALKKVYGKVSKFKNKFNIVVRAKRYYKIPLSKRIFCYIHGFQSDEYTQYALDRNDYREYITEYERLQSRNINSDYKMIMDNKLIYNEVFGKYIKVPEIFMWIKQGIAYPIQWKNNEVLELLKGKQRLVIKPIGAGGGVGVHILKYEHENIYCDGKEVTYAEIEKLVKSYNQAIITEFIVQGEFGNDLFDKTVNTIRIVVAKSKNETEYRIIAAVQRIGREASIPVDNLCNGGLCCAVDLESGRLSKGTSYVNKDGSAPIPYAKHPDTGVQLEGKYIPDWDSVKEQILNVSRRFPYINFFAWDVVITEDGLCALEVNASSGLCMFQLEHGIRNTAFGDIYKSYGIIK